MSFFGSKKKQKVIAVLELASDSVSGMLFRQNKEDNPEVISDIRMPVNFLLDVNFDAFWRCTRASLQKVIEKMLKDYPSGPDACLCVFLSPWFISQTKIINIQKKEPFKITRSFFEKLLKSEEESFKGKGMLCLEREFIKVELNGYHTKSPLEKFAKKARMHLYISLGMEKVETEIEKEVLKNFGDIPLLFKTFPLVVFKILSKIINTQEGLLLVVIGGEITDVLLIRKDSPEETISFPWGSNSLLRKITSEFKTFPKEASSIFQIYLRGHTTEKNAEKTSRIIKEVKKRWCDFFQKALGSISEKGPLPQNIFLAGGEIIDSQFIKCAEDESFSKFTLLGKPFNVKKILAEGLTPYFVAPKLGFGKEKDVLLMLESLYANKVL